jgi:hypothetical protein
MAEEQLHLEEIINLLKDKKCICSHETDILRLFELNPWDFIKFAQQDLNGNSERGMVNALSNLNRAIHCRVEELLCSLNLQPFSSQEGWGYKRRVRVLQDLGIPMRDILQKLTALRNQLEHEYTKPSTDQVKDALDVAQYFLEATDKYLDGGTEGAVVSLYVEAGKWPEQEKVPVKDDYANLDEYESALEDYYAFQAEVRPEQYRVTFDFDRHTIGIVHCSILTRQTRYRKLQLPQDCSSQTVIGLMRSVREASVFISHDELERLEEEFDAIFRPEEAYDLLEDTNEDV